jgi:UDP-N-acetylglucosamine--N-acetylmuramyl-(pentapeptide) pyrophosphoryl-undecaprenol N-acetylglucosamine transferase
MGEALAAADVVVSRAGASSIAEIAALAVPSVLVPYPLATGDHQTTNAHYLVDAKAATLVPDDRLDDGLLADALLPLLDEAERRDAMREAARSLGQDRAAKVLADEVEAAAATS